MTKRDSDKIQSALRMLEGINQPPSINPELHQNEIIRNAFYNDEKIKKLIPELKPKLQKVEITSYKAAKMFMCSHFNK